MLSSGEAGVRVQWKFLVLFLNYYATFELFLSVYDKVILKYKAFKTPNSLISRDSKCLERPSLIFKKFLKIQKRVLQSI